MDRKEYLRYLRSRTQKVLRLLYVAGEGAEVDLDYIMPHVDCSRRQLRQTIIDLEKWGFINRNLKVLNNFPISKRLLVSLTKQGKGYAKYKKEKAKKYKEKLGKEDGDV